MVGPVDNDGSITGDDVCYIYPDMETCLVGQFQQSHLIRASPAEISEAWEEGVSNFFFKEQDQKSTRCYYFDLLTD